MTSTVFLKNPRLTLHLLSAEARRVAYALSSKLRRGLVDARCSVRQGFLRKTVSRNHYKHSLFAYHRILLY
ncbi:hypothetical protein Y032_0563g3517 [Ancylostoma ceylanicum]|uniref:Uncharacterized protein n=1 Tax=Ancylostoma ceylanicum TaxID=53326 RepID=A0A016WQR4_9BILA|nr:hypothetical protein Y032_0563g3517 [Ancylostoma ceylanicum]